MRRTSLFGPFSLVLVALMGLLLLVRAEPALAMTSVFINEIHYDNSGGDVGEAIEIAGPAGTDLSTWSVVLYNGSATQLSPYDTISLSGTLADQGGSCGTLSFTPPGGSIQNGAPDGLALVNSGTVVQFLSYEGSFTAGSGPASGMTSVDIGVSETGTTAAGTSMQLTGTGNLDTDFSWVTGVADNFGAPNSGQTFVGCTGSGGGGSDETLLMTEIVVTPTGGEMVEIHNPTGAAIDLSDVYLSDATFAGGSTYYYNLPTGSNAGGGSFGDFNARFPDGAAIGAGEYQTVSLAGSDGFFAAYGVDPTYELFEDGTADAVPDMREATAGSINGQGGLSNGGEFVVLYSWDGASDLVQDLDYVVWGDKAEAVDKTGVSVDGPDADTDATAYADETAIADQDVVAGGSHGNGNSWQRADLSEGAEADTGGNGASGHDETSEDTANTWCEDLPTPNAEGACSPPSGPAVVVINEIHADPAGDLTGDANGDGVRDSGDDEFIELVNVSGADLDIGEWTLSDGFGLRHTFAAGTSIPTDCAVVIFGGGSPTGSFGSALIQTASSGSLGLNNGGDSVTIRLSDGSTTVASASYGGEGGNNQSLTLDPDIIGTAYVQHSSAAGSAGALFSPGTLIDGSAFAGCELELTLIHDIQGSGSASPLTGANVLIEGIVVGDFQDGLGGVFVQEEDAEADADATTSEGIFVFAPSAPDVNVGDKVSVIGSVTEFGGLTEINNVSDFTVVSTGNTVPAATVITMPVASETVWEQYEGMYVTFADTLSASDQFNWHRFGEVTLSVGGRQFNPTNFMAPGAASADTDGDAVSDINELGRILLDDGSTTQFPDPIPYLGADNTLRLGDTVEGLTGVINEAFGAYRVQPTAEVTFNRVNARVLEVSNTYNYLVVATVNTLNYWTTIDDGTNPGARGADSIAEFERQEAKLVAMIIGLEAHVIGLQELENNGDVAISTLVAALNEATAPGTWAYTPEPAYPGGLESTNAIRNGIIYQPAFIVPVGESIADDDPIFAEDRPPIAQTFSMSGKTFTVVVNHYKSKGCGGSSGLDMDQNDGQSCYNERRRLMSERMLDFVAELQVSSGDLDVIVLGDLNSYSEEDPITTLETGLTNQVDQFVSLEDKYSFTFFGQAGLLDYIFTTPNMDSQILGVEIWHVNTDEPRALSYNDEVIDETEFFGNLEQEILYQPDQFRASDHDPVRAAFNLNGSPNCKWAYPSDYNIWPPNHQMTSISILGVTDYDLDDITITIDGIYQDEPVDGQGAGNSGPDGAGVGTDTAMVRAEREGGGNGRVYTIYFTADDGHGNTCEGEVEVGVPHSKNGHPYNDGPLYDSTIDPNATTWLLNSVAMMRSAVVPQSEDWLA